MQHYNQLLSLKYEGLNLKFESLILLKYFQIISKHTEFKKISEELKTLILDNYKSFDKNDIAFASFTPGLPSFILIEGFTYSLLSLSFLRYLSSSSKVEMQLS